MARPVWKSVHTVIEGALIDRDHGYPDLTLEMRPIGTALPVDQQSRELHLRIGAKETVIDEEGIKALFDFIRLDPSV